MAYCPELDISSCGGDVQHAKEMLKTAVGLFLEEAEKMGTLEDILDESKYKRDLNAGRAAARLPKSGASPSSGPPMG